MYAAAQQLIPEIWPSVNYDTLPLYFNMHRTAQTLVLGIIRQANGRIAPNGRNTLRSTGTEKCNFHKLPCKCKETAIGKNELMII
jgi:hypothetical protein